MKKIISLLGIFAIISTLFTVPSFAEEYLDRSDWTYKVNSEISWAFIDKAFDGKTDTFWHTKYTAEGSTITSKDEVPHTIEITLPKVEVISGFAYLPRQDNATGRWEEIEIYASESGADKGTLVKKASFDYQDTKLQTVSFGKNVKAKKVTIVITKAAGGFGSCAEFNLIGTASGAANDAANTGNTENTAPVTLDKSNWTIKASSEISWGFVDEAIDGDAKTYWHTMYTAEGSTITSKAELPHILEITLPALESISGMNYLPRQDGQSGRWLEIEIYASETGADKGALVKKATFEQTNQDLQTVDFGKTVKAKKVTIVVTKSAGGHGTCAEIDFYKNGTASSAPTETTVKTLDKSEWTIKANSEISWGLADFAIDGNEKNTWHTNYKAEGSTIISKDEGPHTLEITFPRVEEITAMKYLPRQDGQSGRWLVAEIYASESGADKGTLIKNETFVQTDSVWKTISFGKTVKAKKITIVITKSAAGFGTCSEIDFICEETSGNTETESNPYPEKFDTSLWKITASSEKNWGPIEKAFDGNFDTYWHTYYDEADGKITGHAMPPYDVDIVLPELTVITGFAVTPRKDQTAGKIKAYRLYASREDDGELTLLMEGELLGALATEKMEFECGIEVRRIRFEVLEGQGGYATMAELEFFPAKPDTQIVPFADLEKTMNENKIHRIDPNSIKMTNDLPTWANTKIGAVSDGDPGSHWQTEEIISREPVIIGADLGEVRTVSSISIAPRQSADFHGYWLKFNIWASVDGNEYTPVAENYSFPKRTMDEKFIELEESVTARYFEFEVLEYSSYRVSCAEISFWQTYEDKTKSGDSGKFTLKVGSNEIKVENGSDSHVKTIDVAPYITSAGSTLIPLRGLLEEMGCEIIWDGDTQTITLKKGLLEIKLQIQNKLVYVEDPIYGHTMDTLTSAPRIKDSRTFIPVRFVSEMLGYNVAWDGATQTITITK